MYLPTAPSNLSEAILTSRNLEKTFLKNQYLTIDRDRKKIRLSLDRHKETFLQLTRKQHDAWHRHDKYFRDALIKEKDRHEKRKQRYGSATNPEHLSLPSLITINSRVEPLNKVEQRTFQVLQASQKLLDESSTKSAFQSRPSTIARSQHTSSARKSSSLLSGSLIVPMTQSIDSDEYTRLMNESLKRETFCDFVDHFAKFRPEFREQFPQFHQNNQRETAVEKLRKHNQIFGKTKDRRYYNLISSLTDFNSPQKR